MANNINVITLKGCLSEKPNKYPTIEEKTTLIAKPAFVISLKSKKIDFTFIVVAFKSKFLIECKDSKKILVFAILTELIQNIKLNKKAFETLHAKYRIKKNISANVRCFCFVLTGKILL